MMLNDEITKLKNEKEKILKDEETLKKDLYFYKNQVDSLKQREIVQKNESFKMIKENKGEYTEEINYLKEIIQIRDNQNQDLMNSNLSLNSELAKERLKNLELNQKITELYLEILLKLGITLFNSNKKSLAFS